MMPTVTVPGVALLHPMDRICRLRWIGETISGRRFVWAKLPLEDVQVSQ